jgi:hypothetical protein
MLEVNGAEVCLKREYAQARCFRTGRHFVICQAPERLLAT